MADAGMSRDRPRVTERSRPVRISSYITLWLIESTIMASVTLYSWRGRTGVPAGEFTAINSSVNIQSRVEVAGLVVLAGSGRTGEGEGWAGEVVGLGALRPPSAAG
jgi:hypothetical protein